ncbi:MAG: inorganic phosphate transporter [Xanthobacteraceae bacterium]|nr:inorganic phosphate transporter [Hyphomicrobiales bacterium]MBN8984027.1 inorganic phosphate transporter [Hyphomicrobiales bacterium]
MDATIAFPVLVGLIAVALLFDFLNGLHDAANSIATIVSTRVLRPQYAVFWAAFFNFVAFLVFGLHVANTIGTGIIEPDLISPAVIFAALVGAIVWNLVTWALGIPSSSSHALIGGLVGAGVAKAGLVAVVWSGLSMTLLAIVLSPVVGFLLALVLVAIVTWASARSTPFAVDRAFRIFQFFSASLYSLGHGGNDAQKTMGIIAVLLYSQGHLGGEFSVPFWVVLACQSAMALGTLLGGWRIVRTMGLRITRLTPMQGFCAETGGAATLFMATFLGVPVSTTHTITGAIVGVGAARRLSAVRWNVASSIVYAWVITVPASAIVAALAYWAVMLVQR